MIRTVFQILVMVRDDRERLKREVKLDKILRGLDA